MTNAAITIHDTHAALPTVLGRRSARIPTGGKIRAGIKVLTRTAAENPIAKDLYARGVAANQSFDAIARAISEAIPELTTPLVPKNVPWFTVRPDDFPNPALAGQILETFGEDRGDGVRRLYRFPVVFPSDVWQVVMPHELVTWGANEKKYWSEYAPDGRERYCKTYVPMTTDQAGRRALRPFGGRKTMPRVENSGSCDPERCPEYQSRRCNLSGRFIFFIPGIKSINAFELQTNSFYAMSRAIEQFEMVAFLRGGRISGFLDGRQTPFYITKKLREVPHLDEEGRSVRSAHWIIELEAPIDIAALLRANDENMAVPHANEAARVLQGEVPGATMESVAPAIADTQESEANGIGGQAAADSMRAPVTMPARERHAPVPERSRTSAVAPTGTGLPPGAHEAPTAEQVVAAAAGFGLDPARYAAYADQRWGSGWRLNANGRRRALDEIEQFADCPNRLLDKIDAELDAQP